MAGKILVVDDDDLVLGSIVRLLKRQGYEAHQFADGLGAYSAIETGSYNLAIVDLRMPKLSGLELMARIRNREKERGWPRLPAIIMTGGSDEWNPSHLVELELDAFLEKPYKIDELIALVKRHILD
jgi:DNA-binding response OmpR family regulator